MNQRLKMAFENFNGSALVPDSCAKDFDKNNQWKCMLSEYRFKYLKTPFVLITDQYDDFHLGSNLPGNIREPINKEQMKYALDFGKKTKDYLNNFDNKK